jgi:2-oxoglutarate dehydrogenase E2 component (dihydrolipoamide succinyltransferase)
MPAARKNIEEKTSILLTFLEQEKTERITKDDAVNATPSMEPTGGSHSTEHFKIINVAASWVAERLVAAKTETATLTTVQQS